MQVLVIGDVVTDAFVKLKDENAKVITEDDGSEWLAMPHGQKLQFESDVILPGVGNSANVAVSMSRLGVDSAFVSNVGDDAEGPKIIDYLQEQGIDTKYVKVNEGMPTNYHYYLRYKSDRCGLIKRVPYENHLPALAEAPEWLYLSAVGDETALPFHDEIVDYLEANPDTKLAFQPSTYHIDFGKEKLARLYARTEIFVANKEEVAKITGADVNDIPALAAAMHELGPKFVAITDGPDGAYGSDGERILKIENYPDPAPPLERTGAGDAFTSGFVAAFISGEGMETGLQWGPINSMSVVQKVGAQEGLVTKDELEKYLADAPDTYVPNEI